MHYGMELIFYTLDSGLKSAEKCATVKNHTLFALIAKKKILENGVYRELILASNPIFSFF